VPVEQNAVRTCSSNSVPLSEFLTGEKIPPISIHHHMHAVYGNKCVDVSTARCWVWQFKQKVRGSSGFRRNEETF